MFLWSLVLGAWCFRRSRPRTLTLTLLLTLPAPAFSCRYNIREIGFVDVSQPKFRLTVFVHGDEHKDWLPGFQQTATRLLGSSNVSWEVIDEVQQPDSPDLRHRAQLGPRLPGGMVLAHGRDGGWPVFLRVPQIELNTKLSDLVVSSSRAQITSAVIETYGAVLLLRGQDQPANLAARTAANEAIKAIESTLADLPKRIEHGPRLIECDPSFPDEQILGWSLGVNGKDLPKPVVAVIYGRGRLAGPALKGDSLTTAKIKDQLSLIGADCECTLDHAWMTAPSIPVLFTPALESRLPGVLGFDPSAASVKAEVHNILQTQARVAADPNARPGSGYRETPLDGSVPIPPGFPATATSPPSPNNFPLNPWLIAAIVAAALLAFIAILLLRRRLRTPQEPAKNG
jgi:hypothetical protein